MGMSIDHEKVRVNFYLRGKLLKAEFIEACAFEKKDMTEVLNEFIRTYVQKQKQRQQQSGYLETPERIGSD